LLGIVNHRQVDISDGGEFEIRRERELELDGVFMGIDFMKN